MYIYFRAVIIVKLNIIKSIVVTPNSSIDPLKKKKVSKPLVELFSY